MQLSNDPVFDSFRNAGIKKDGWTDGRTDGWMGGWTLLVGRDSRACGKLARCCMPNYCMKKDFQVERRIGYRETLLKNIRKLLL